MAGGMSLPSIIGLLGIPGQMEGALASPGLPSTPVAGTDQAAKLLGIPGAPIVNAGRPQAAPLATMAGQTNPDLQAEQAQVLAKLDPEKKAHTPGFMDRLAAGELPKEISQNKATAVLQGLMAGMSGSSKADAASRKEGNDGLSKRFEQIQKLLAFDNTLAQQKVQAGQFDATRQDGRENREVTRADTQAQREQAQRNADRSNSLAERTLTSNDEYRKRLTEKDATTGRVYKPKDPSEIERNIIFSVKNHPIQNDIKRLSVAPLGEMPAERAAREAKLAAANKGLAEYEAGARARAFPNQAGAPNGTPAAASPGTGAAPKLNLPQGWDTTTTLDAARKAIAAGKDPQAVRKQLQGYGLDPKALDAPQVPVAPVITSSTPAGMGNENQAALAMDPDYVPEEDEV